jgi:DNA recombination protein RmuC
MTVFLLTIIMIIAAAGAIMSLILFFRGSNAPVSGKLESIEKSLERIGRDMKDEVASNRQEMAASLKGFSETSSAQLIGLTRLNEQKLDNIRKTVEDNLKSMQNDNNSKLELIRSTVDEKLHETLERRLGDSFKLVSERLELVHKGLGEMQQLANGVGDLKKVLSNVKMRGTLGEVQLGNILDQMLTPEQYARNVATKKDSRENVEYAIKLPGRNDQVVWLPIDAKFPLEDYHKLIEAQERGDLVVIEDMGKALEARIKSEAKDIRDKYIDPPSTTDFGILFLPFEGLFAEVLRRPGLYEILQRDYKVIITGPTTIAAFLNSLQMGFRTLVIEKRASEVWGLLAAVKSEFGKFGEMLDKTHKQLQAASNTIEDAAKKTRTIERKLKDVQALPAQDAGLLIDSVEEAGRL